MVVAFFGHRDFRADIVICYVKREYGGAFQAIKYAERKDKRVINLVDIK